MIQRVIAVGRQVGTPTGIHCMEPEEALLRAQQGMQFLAIGSDLRMLSTRAAAIAATLAPGATLRQGARY